MLWLPKERALTKDFINYGFAFSDGREKAQFKGALTNSKDRASKNAVTSGSFLANSAALEGLFMTLNISAGEIMAAALGVASLFVFVSETTQAISRRYQLKRIGKSMY